MIRLSILLVVAAGALGLARLPYSVAEDAKATPAAQKQEPSDSDVLAIVNGERITRRQVADQLMVFYGRVALNWFIDATLIEQEAKKDGVTVSPEEVKAGVEKEFDQLMAQYRLKSRDELAAFAKRQGDSLEAMRERRGRTLRRDLLAEKLLRKRVTVTPEEIQDRYDKKYGPRVEAQQIVVATKKEADDLVQKIRDGADFAILARELSLDTASKGSGGRLPPQPSDSDLGRAMAEMKEGDVSDPVPIGDRYHILKVNKRLNSEEKKLSDVEGEIREALMNEKMDALRGSWHAALKDKADVQYFLP